MIVRESPVIEMDEIDPLIQPGVIIEAAGSIWEVTSVDGNRAYLKHASIIDTTMWCLWNAWWWVKDKFSQKEPEQ